MKKKRRMSTIQPTMEKCDTALGELQTMEGVHDDDDNCVIGDFDPDAPEVQAAWGSVQEFAQGS